MNEDIITLCENNENKDYRLLCILEKDYKYLIYTDLNNTNIYKNIYAIKTKSLNNDEESLPISTDEWKMIENEYNKLIEI